VTAFSTRSTARDRPRLAKRTHPAELVLGAWLGIFGVADAGVPRLQSYQAKNHVREAATVCGVVVSAQHAESSRRSPTFLDLDHPDPQQPFTIVIWGADRAKFGTPEISYAGKRVCVTGTIEEDRGTPRIVATDPSQIRIE
jgi:hypothetical protein